MTSASTSPLDGNTNEPISYPTNHLVGVVDSTAQVSSLVADLTSRGFSDADIHVHRGKEDAEALDASTGRTGIAGLAIRIAETLGIENFEMEQKDRYEQALRDGHYVVLVGADNEERKVLATDVFERHGAHTVAFHGRFAITDIVAPKDEQSE